MWKYRGIRILVYSFATLIVFLIALLIYIQLVAVVHPPKVIVHHYDSIQRKEIEPGYYTLDNNWLRKNKFGLYEMYVEGEPYERGLAIGVLGKELIQHQEEAFVKQINKLVSSPTYLLVLKYFVGWFNRDLEENVIEEYREEIYGVSRAASDKFNYIANPYQRILNYHAAHDIGHALQNMALVGCTSFAVWNDKSADSTLTIGRNFDFFVGEEFAKDKIVAFYKPDKGHPFMMITWGGMTGVLSGMNAEGLTVTINAAKSEIPHGSATPVSLVAREILQYASTIREAYAIAKKRKMFVAESFLIGSAKDNRAALIEKTPEGIALYESNGTQIISTNHFQSSTLGNTELNKTHMLTSASPYRYQRVEELISSYPTVSVTDAVKILRDQKGIDNSDIGLGNEKAINQLVAHHSIIFQPQHLRIWVSTNPWQLGEYIAYDLNSIFNLDKEIPSNGLENIPQDEFIQSEQYQNFTKFSKYRFPFEPRTTMNPDSMVKWNPNSYLSYMLAGDFYFDKGEFDHAEKTYAIGLTKEIATAQEHEHMLNRLSISKSKVK